MQKEKNTNVRVCVRCRPLNSTEKVGASLFLLPPYIHTSLTQLPFQTTFFKGFIIRAIFSFALYSTFHSSHTSATLTHATFFARKSLHYHVRAHTVLVGCFHLTLFIFLFSLFLLKGNGNKTTVKIDINRGTVAVNNPDQSKGVPPKTFTFGAYRSKIKERLRVFGVCS